MLPEQEFDAIVERAFRRVPAQFRSRMKNIVIMIETEPSDGQLARAGVLQHGILLGLYEGRPLRYRSVFEPFGTPDRITIFQVAHERIARDRKHLENLVQQTLSHEIAHYFGMNEREVRLAERQRGRQRRWPH